LCDPAEILIIDDEVQMRTLLEITLQTYDYTVRQAATAKQGIMMAVNHPPDMILLDLGLPDEDGHIVLQKLREWYTKPIIIISVQSNEENIIKALDMDANDYLIKPFRTGELLARIRSALRNAVSEQNIAVINCNDLQIDLSQRTVRKNNQLINLTLTEYILFALFVKNEGKVLTHHYLLREVWGPGYINQSQYLRVYIAQLRKKIEDDPNNPEYFITQPGIGYRFVLKE
jgi:two-component system KDP operon response regulator KdpE